MMPADRVTEARKAYRDAEAARVARAPTHRKGQPQQSGLWARFSQHVESNNELTRSHNDLTRSHSELARKHELDVNDLSQAIDIMGLYVRWQRQRIDRLERLLIASGTLKARDLKPVGDFDRKAYRGNDVVTHLTSNADVIPEDSE